MIRLVFEEAYAVFCVSAFSGLRMRNNSCNPLHNPKAEKPFCGWTPRRASSYMESDPFGKRLAHGAFLATSSKRSRCSWLSDPRGSISYSNTTSSGSVRSSVTRVVTPERGRACWSATMRSVILMQLANAASSNSWGRKPDPLPLFREEGVAKGGRDKWIQVCYLFDRLGLGNILKFIACLFPKERSQMSIGAYPK